MKPLREEDLIAFHMGDLSFFPSEMVARKIELDPQLTAESEEIAATLRVFSDSAATPSADAVEQAKERAWERVRGSLTVLEPAKKRTGKRWFWVGTSVGATCTAVLVAALTLHWATIPPAGKSASPVGLASMKSWGPKLLEEIHARKPGVRRLNDRPGPLTTGPVDAVAENPALAAHLDTAERVLTEVSHTEGALPDEMRAQVHDLLVKNAVYHQTAESRGDLATAAVMDDLGRVLISLDAEPQPGAHAAEAKPDAFRLQMNIGNVLLDLRILHHSDGPQ